ncbi:hypothetical protein IGI04_035617 [Brassica rapa subsp. trilocularis]|uniref:Uncharacterized protein n=1 Tax=Brassica rapa subsp. trilocularis TaxID=1813537 RepID=A0ABQ7LD30_BRACM|nr:hypothetical protein IGI04_035617 [Brassica rapa subsp. trilocularis]
MLIYLNKLAAKDKILKEHEEMGKMGQGSIQDCYEISVLDLFGRTDSYVSWRIYKELLHGNAGKRGVFPNSTLATALEALVKLSSTLIGVKVTRPLPDLRNLCLCVTAICTFQKSYPRRPPLAIYPTSNTITSVKFKNASQTLGLLPSFIPSCSSNLIFSVKIPFSDVFNGSQQIFPASILRHHQISYFTVLGSAPSPRNCYVLEANRLLPLWSFGMTR